MKKLLFAIPFLAVVLVACPDPVTPPQTIGSSGGMVSSANTVASVVFPAGALSVDTPVTITDGSTLLLSVEAAGAVTYRWRKETVPLNDGPSAGGGVISGANSNTLTVSTAHAADAGSYDCVATNDCGSSTSIVAFVTVTCPADFNGDGFLDFFDYNDFVTAFETGGGLEADFNGDGFVDFFDYLDFVTAFEAGC